MKHRDYDRWIFWFEDELTYAHFEESHGEIGGLVDACFRKNVDPAVVRLIEESDGVVHGRLVDSSGAKRWIAIDWQCLAECEEECV